MIFKFGQFVATVYTFAVLAISSAHETKSIRSRNLRHLSVVRLFPDDTEGVYSGCEFCPGGGSFPYTLGTDYPSWIYDPPNYPDLKHRSGQVLSYEISGFEPLSTHFFYMDFAEAFEPNCEIGRRLMDVTINGVVIKFNIDVFAEVGCNQMTTSVRAPVIPANADGTYKIYIEASNDKPMMSAIHIEPSTAPQYRESILINSKYVNDGSVYEIEGSTRTYGTGRDISNTDEWSTNFFRDMRSGDSFKYLVKGWAPNVEYELTIGFAETYEPNCEAGKRVFDVKVNGETFAEDLDVYTAAGSACFTGYTISKTVKADTDGLIMISFDKSGDRSDQAMVSFFQVAKSAETPAPTTPAPTLLDTPAPITAAPTTVATSRPTSAPTSVPTSICASGKEPRELRYSLSIQELQSPPGDRHSDGIFALTDSEDVGTQHDVVWFSNDLVKPLEGSLQGGDLFGDQTGHCVQVERGDNAKLACYFNFRIESGDMSGRIAAEALFDLTNFPAANLVITGGTDSFVGIVGSGCTSIVPGFPFDGTTFIYNFFYDLR